MLSHTYAHTHTLKHTHTCSHAYTHTLKHTHTHAHTHTCPHTHTHTHTCSHTFTHIHTCSHSHTCSHTYALTHIYTCSHTLTHTSSVHTTSLSALRPTPSPLWEPGPGRRGPQCSVPSWAAAGRPACGELAVSPHVCSWLPFLGSASDRRREVGLKHHGESALLPLPCLPSQRGPVSVGRC